MTDLAFVDTNIWVYAVDDADPVKQARAREVLDPAHGASLVCSAQVLGEFYLTVTRRLARPVGPDIAARMVERMRRLPVVEIDAERVREAIEGSRSWQVSYWDALIVAAAHAAGCTRLITEDLAAGAVYDGVLVENPFMTGRRASERSSRYDPRRHAWDDADLDDELARYQEAATAAGMRPNAVHSYWDYARRFLAWRSGEYHPRGAAHQGRPVPHSPATAAELALQADAYAVSIEQAGREPATIDTYHRHAMYFVRWLGGQFRPGDRLR